MAASDTYDILVVDGAYKQTLACARSLTRAGLRVALGESVGQFRFGRQPAPFRSRYCARAVELPDYIGDPAPYVEAVVAFAREHRVRVVLPAGDASVRELAPHRDRFAAFGCTLAVAPDAALEIAGDKNRTLEVAAKLGIAFPKSVEVTGVQDLREAEAEFGYPFVLKPTMSWTGEGEERVSPVDVVDEAEALRETRRFLATGCGVLAQQLATGRREALALLMADGEVLSACASVYHRTIPLLGGVSTARESIAIPADILDASVSLVTAVGVEGPCEVEWRRDAQGRPLLMEINARLIASLEHIAWAGIDMPVLVWQWATGQPVRPARSYRAGVRSRWLGGELRWLWDNVRVAGRPDTVPLPRAVWVFLSDFARTRHYDFVDRRDMRPALAELRETVQVVLQQFRR